MAFQEDFKASFDHIEIRDEAIARIREKAATAHSGVPKAKFMRIAAACMSLVIICAAIAALGNGSSKAPAAAASSSSASLQAVQSAPLTLSEQFSQIPTEGRIPYRTAESSNASFAAACMAFNPCYETLFYNGNQFISQYKDYEFFLDAYGWMKVINRYRGEKLGETQYKLNQRYVSSVYMLVDKDHGDDTANPYWGVSGASTVPVGTTLYAVNGYSTSDALLCITEDSAGFPHPLFFTRVGSEPISKSGLVLYSFNIHDYIDNIEKSQFIDYYEMDWSTKRAVKEVDSSLVNALLKDMAKQTPKTSTQDEFNKLYQKTDTVQNVMDGIHTIQLMTKDKVILNLEITNSGYVAVLTNETMVYQPDTSVWRAVWDSLTLQEFRAYMDSQNYYYHDGVGGYVLKGVPYDAPKLKEEMERMKQESSEE